MILGFDVGPYSLRSLVRMAESKLMLQWDHTSFVCAAIYNSRMGVKKSQIINPSKLNPYRKSLVKSASKASLAGFGRALNVPFPDEWK